MLAWYLSQARCRFAYGPADASATPSSLASLKSRMVLPFCCRLILIVLKKRPLNRYSSSTNNENSPPKSFGKSSISTPQGREWSHPLYVLLAVQCPDRCLLITPATHQPLLAWVTSRKHHYYYMMQADLPSTLKSANWYRRPMKLASMSRTCRLSTDSMYFLSFSCTKQSHTAN